VRRAGTVLKAAVAEDCGWRHGTVDVDSIAARAIGALRLGYVGTAGQREQWEHETSSSVRLWRCAGSKPKDDGG
jgi:uncharacterized protein YcfJ